MFTDRIDVFRTVGVVTATLVCAALAGCDGARKPASGGSEVDWARAALARNSALEVVAIDDKARVFTVRDKASGELRTVPLEDLVAVPRSPEAGGAAARASAPIETAPPAPLAAGTSPSAGAAADAAATAVAGAPAEAPASASASGQPADTIAAGNAEYSIERDRNGVKITGRGVSITSVNATSDAAGGARAATPGTLAAVTEVDRAGPPPGLERRNEPLRCQGGKLLRLDNQRIAFAGDGIVAEQGCELYLTNSRIEALGNALLVDASKVHVINTTLIGGTSSLELRHGSEAYVGGSTLRGMSRRFDSSQLHDLGTNKWN